MSELLEVPFYDGARSFEQVWPRTRELVEAVMDDGKWSHGRTVEQLEQAIELYTGCENAVAVGSGTDALVILLRAAGIGEDDEVIVPCFTFFASASSVALNRATPVFVDIEPGSYALDPKAVERAITPRTKAIMPVHLFSQMADMGALAEISDRHGIPLIEDSAEAIGMFYDGLHAGRHGLGGVLSFFPTKTLGALGDAGMILSEDPMVADRCRIIRHHGRMGTTVGRISGISNAARLSGTNSKMDEIQAAFLLARLPHLTQEIARRAALARHYDALLADVEGVTTPTVVDRGVAADPVFYVYLIEVDRRDDLVAFLTSRGIGTEQYYPRPLHLQPCFAGLGGRAGDFPVAEAACERTLALPFYPDLDRAGVERVCEAIAEFLA